WGRNFIRTLQELDDVRLSAVASRNPETLALVPSDCRVDENWRDVVNDPGLDGVIIATPPATHADIAIAAINAGKPVLIEKPLTMAVADAGRIGIALDRSPVPFLVDHIHLFHRAFRALCAEAMAVGPVRSITSAAGNHGPYRHQVPVLW